MSIFPFPGMITRPKYGGDGVPPPAGTGAKATGLKLASLQVVKDQYPV